MFRWDGFFGRHWLACIAGLLAGSSFATFFSLTRSAQRLQSAAASRAKSLGSTLSQDLANMRSRIFQQPLEVGVALRLSGVVKTGTGFEQNPNQRNIGIPTLLRTTGVSGTVYGPADW